MVIARFGAHLGGRPSLEADGHCIRGAWSRRREVNELVLLEDVHTLVSTPADEMGRGYRADRNYGGWANENVKFGRDGTLLAHVGAASRPFRSMERTCVRIPS